MIVFCHLRWDFVYQRPQHLISRLSKNLKILVVEEPIGRADHKELEGFLPGDYLVIRADLDAKNNDLGIVYIPGDGFSAKKIDLKNKCLKPLNKEFPILTIPEGEVIETRGVVKTIFREVKNLD